LDAGLKVVLALRRLPSSAREVWINQEKADLVIAVIVKYVYNLIQQKRNVRRSAACVRFVLRVSS
jgi:hypothetical protein